MILDDYGDPTGEDQFELTLHSSPDPRGGYLQHRLPLMDSEDTVVVRVMYWIYPDGRFRYVWLKQNEGRWWVLYNIEYRGLVRN